MVENFLSDSFQRDVIIKEALRKEKDINSTIREEYEERESGIVREKAAIQKRLDDLIKGSGFIKFKLKFF